MISALIIGFGPNYKPYGGTFDSAMSLETLFIVYAVSQILPFPFYRWLEDERIAKQDVPSLKNPVFLHSFQTRHSAAWFG
mmetsp:Transcript_11847/g.19302  ORF Transcript_11847/g.19302 Transcript_11847/m.19302 type:complete len:80 (-) Transcript_11847:53-292(-)